MSEKEEKCKDVYYLQNNNNQQIEVEGLLLFRISCCTTKNYINKVIRKVLVLSRMHFPFRELIYKISLDLAATRSEQHKSRNGKLCSFHFPSAYSHYNGILLFINKILIFTLIFFLCIQYIFRCM